MDNNCFSVAMSVYKNDNAVHFDRALQSITDDQTVRPNEIVLVVDGPVGSEINSVIDKYAEKYGIFKILRLEQNGGLGNALRLAVENSTYGIIARMDSDDVSLPYRFEEQLKLMNETDADVVGGFMTEFIGEEKNVIGVRAVAVGDREIKLEMKKRCAVNHVTSMYKKSAVTSSGGYLDWYCNEDYYLWIRMMLKGYSFANSEKTFVNVRVGEEMYRRRGGKKYFISEARLQGYMLKNKLISFPRYMLNVNIRLAVQLLLPNAVRGWVFKKFARKPV